MPRTILIALISFFYSMSYAIVLDEDIFIFPFLYKQSNFQGVWSNDVKSMRILLYSMLSIILILLIIFLYKKIRGRFIIIYIPSLLASFFMPKFFSSLNSSGGLLPSIPWYFTGILVSVGNLLFGPAMIFLLSYIVLKILKI